MGYTLRYDRDLMGRGHRYLNVTPSKKALKKHRETIDLKNQADQLAFAAEKTLKEQGEKVSPESRSNIESAISNLREVSKGDDGEAIKRSMEDAAMRGEAPPLPDEEFKEDH